MRLLRRRPSEESVTAAVAGAVGATPGEVSYNHLQYGSGALSGVVEVAGAAEFGEVLRRSYAALADVLGDDAERVVFYLTGRSPAGTVGPADLGLPDRPSGRDVARMSTLEGPGQEA